MFACWPHEYNGNTVKTYWFPNPNVRIICDQYDGNGCGNAHDFWDEYKAYYGILNRNFSNWITLNNGNSADRGNLLNLAMAWGMNPIWIYGLDSNVNEGVVQSFCSTAWQTGWLLRLGRTVTVFYQCFGDCTTCNWPDGNWTGYSIQYGSYQWVHY